jgi:hypothetical protein
MPSNDVEAETASDVAPVCAVAGGFPNLPPTTKPLGVEVEHPGYRRCKSCGVEHPWREFRYANGGNVAATCLDCRTGG